MSPCSSAAHSLLRHVLAVDVLQVHEPLAEEGERALVGGVDVMRDGVNVEVGICRTCMASGQGRVPPMCQVTACAAPLSIA